MLSGADLPMPGTSVDVVVDGRVVTGRVEQLRPTGLVVELAADLPGDGSVELSWPEPAGLRVVRARRGVRWATRTGVRWQLVPDGPSRPVEGGDAVRAPLRLRVRVTDRDTGAATSGRTTDLSETGLRCLLAPADRAPRAGAAVDVGLTLRGTVFPLPGRLHRVLPAEGGWDVVVAFDELCPSLVELLRAQVSAALREQWRLSLP